MAQLHFPFIFQESSSVINTPLIAPNHFRGVNKRLLNSQEKLHHLVLSLFGRITVLHRLLHQKILRELVGVMNFTLVTPEHFWGINCVILEGPMV